MLQPLTPADLDALKLRLVRHLEGQVVAPNTPGRALKALQTVARVLRNRLDLPGEPKFQSIRGRNPTFSSNVLAVDGMLDVLLIFGFSKKVVDFEETYFVPGATDTERLLVQFLLPTLPELIEKLEAKLAKPPPESEKSQGSIRRREEVLAKIAEDRLARIERDRRLAVKREADRQAEERRKQAQQQAAERAVQHSANPPPVTTAAQAGTASGGMAAASAGADQHTGESDAALAARLLRRFSAFPSGMRREFLLLLLKSCDPSDMQYLGKVLPVLHRDFIARLPRNVSQRILMYVRPCDLAISAQVSRMWHSIVSEEALWTRLYGLIGLQSMADVFFQPQKSVKANAKRLSSMGHWAHGHFTYRAFRAHSLGVLTMAFDSKHVVTGSIDRTCRVFLLKTGQCIRTLVGHEGGVYAAQFDSDKVGGHASLL
ncbi:hypothetical protein HK105_202154 [Polyrhizophydium stewartii]|uniref:F-box domain-containing protein n=1 Tax=Polyrhizophydium stewartii TaxID=2732419 RepID=A0ABR4NFC3_9FUNG